jgi:hypothetical protein
MNIVRKLLFVLCFIAVAGCSSTSSENVTTQGISADIDVYADGSGRTYIRVDLHVGDSGLGGTSLMLGPSDTLTAQANGVLHTLTEDASIFGEYSYVTFFDVDDANTIFTVSLERAAGTTAPNSNVALPDGFIVSSPSIGEVFGSSDTIPIIWSPSGTSIVPEVFVTLTCTLTSGLMMTDLRLIALGSDTGSTSVSVASLIPLGTIDTSRPCDGTLELSRWRSGNLDPNYGEGGQIDAEHAKNVSFSVDLSR